MGKNPPANAGDVGLILGLERSPGKENGSPSPVFLPGNSMDIGACWTTVYEASKS